MKKLLSIVVLFFTSTLLLAQPIKQIVFFGDSLTDNGNLYHYLKIIPKSPPYFQGRFSNGFTWADYISKYFYDKFYIDSENYAVGGATVILRNPIKGFLPLTLREEVNDYLLRSMFSDRKDTLFVVWAGANDYLKGQADVEASTSEVVDEIDAVILTLVNYGAKNLLVMNLPDLVNTPGAKTMENPANFHDLTLAHNKKLTEKIEKLKADLPNIKIVYIDIFSLFNDLLAHPDLYNKEFHTAIKNTVDACWQGGYTLKRKDKHAEISQLNDELKKLFLKDKEGKPIQSADLQKLSYFLSNSPSISEALQTSQLYAEGLRPCDDANAYVFWDSVHPTETMHLILAQKIFKDLLADGIQG